VQKPSFTKNKTKQNGSAGKRRLGLGFGLPPATSARLNPLQSKDRAQWGSSLEFILTVVGFAVGLGNVSVSPASPLPTSIVRNEFLGFSRSGDFRI
jgi:hypothetical protein